MTGSDGSRRPRLREHAFLIRPLPFLVPADDGTFRLPADARGELPMMFSILATELG